MFEKFGKKTYLPILASGLFIVGTGYTYTQDFFEIAKQIEIFTTLYKTVHQNYVDQTNPGELMDVAIKNMLKELDPYTVYFNEQDVVKFKINNTGEYTGIGASLYRKDGKVFIVEPYKNYPADKAGLKAGDQILQINDIKTADYKEDIGQLLKGTKNTQVKLIYMRADKQLSTTLILDDVDIKAVPFYSMLDDQKTGYIILTQFNAKTSQEVKAALVDLKKKGAQQLILDLRNNPGGLLQEAVNLCNLFVAKNELIVTTKGKDSSKDMMLKTQMEPVDLQIPLSIIINEKSASASEIVAGALQDLDRAVIIGNRSFGKGLVQRPIDLAYGTQLKVTISKYYTPSGRCIQALDYAHKDAQGKAIKIKENQYQKFLTKAGRTVYDGGGISPDVEIKTVKQSKLAKTLENERIIFHYATSYVNKNPQQTVIKEVTDQEFQDFKLFVRNQNVSLQTETSKALTNVLEEAKKEHIDQKINTAFQTLKQEIKKAEESELDANKDEIKRLIKEELIKRYQYQEGLYLYYTKNSPEILRAVSTMTNRTEYDNIFKK